MLADFAATESDFMKQEMLINVSQPEECRIAIVEDAVLEELYIERTGADNYVGNIYKGVVVNLEPSIQAAFVDFGVGHNGFLHISDIEPQYFRQGGYDPERPIESPSRRRREDEEEGDRPRSRQGLHPGSRPRVKPPDPGNPPPRRRSPRSSHQGRHWHQGADAFHVHQHSRPLPRAHAGLVPGGRFPQDRG